MGLLIQISQFFLSLSLLIVLHEGGHYLAARLFKTRVEKFYLFFDFLFPFPNLLKFSLFKWKKGDTEYGLGWFPLGGYVKIAGMMDESDDKEALKQPVQPWEYRAKPAWQRLIIILGGIIVNVIAGFFIFAMVFWTYGEDRMSPKNMPYGMHFSDSSLLDEGLKQGDIIYAIDGIEIDNYTSIPRNLLLDDVKTISILRNGSSLNIQMTPLFKNKLIRAAGAGGILEPALPPIFDSVVPGFPAEKAGIASGDVILSMDSLPIQSYQDIQERLTKPNQTYLFEVKRSLDTVWISITCNEEAKIGVLPPLGKRLEALGYSTTHVEFSFAESFPAGIGLAYRTIADQVKQFGLIFRPSTGAYKQVGGFKRFTELFPEYWSWQAFWKLTAIISLILAFMNFLPIPMLDGGYMIFILFEMVTGRPPGEKFMEKANTIGFVLILALLIYANLNDFIR
ncbi:MAG: RIP metalloprotease RseP [Bacteroidetes bacterium]|nr:RIP metalloprotease RseP [Bacteroidota bacterium]